MRTPSSPGYFAIRLLAFAGAVALPLLLVLGFFLKDGVSKDQSVAQEKLTSQAKEAANEINALLSRAESTLDFLRGRDEITSQNWAACDKLLEGMLHIDQLYHNIWVADPAGQVVCSSFNPDKRQVDYGTEPWFHTALTSTLYILGDPSTGKFFPRPRAALMSRVEAKSGTPIAVISVSLNLEALSARIRSLTVSETNVVTLVNSQALVFARSHAPEKFVGTRLPQQTAAMLAAPRATLFAETGPDGIARMYSAFPVGKHQLHVAAGMPEAEVFASSRQAFRGAAIAFLAALGLSVAMALIGARTLTRPLNALASVARKRAEGALSARAPSELEGEFGVVAKEFNRMLDSQERSERMLRHSEQRAQRMAEFYSALSETNQALGRVRDASALYDIVCSTCVQASHAKIAWVGLLREGQVRPVASQGPFEGFVEKLVVDVEGCSASAQGPAATAARTGETVVIDDMWSDPRTAYWVDNCKRYGVRSMVATPFTQGGQVCGVLCVYMQEADFFDEPLVALLQELALAVSFALESWEREEQRTAAETAAKQALQEKAKAEASDAAKTQFLTRMGHELRTPLNAILGFVQLLKERTGPKLDDKERGQLDLIFKAGSQLRLMLDDALDFNRAESGEMVLNPQVVDVCALVEEATELVSPLAAEAGVEVRRDCPRSRSLLCLVIDPARLRQALLNLLSNSIRYNRNGGWVRVSAHTGTTGLVLTLEDNGWTLTGEQLSRIFEPFTASGAGSQRVSRSGLGMMLTRQLVETLGGRLTVESEEGKGTRIRVLLPNLEAPKQSEADGVAQEVEAPGTSELAAEGTVVYIEDNPINAALVQEALEPWPDIRVVIAETGEKGIELVRTLRPDLVLLDMQLPDISGQEVLERLRTLPETREQRVVVLSASALPEVRKRAQAAGVVDYWLKPLDFPPLVKAIRKHLIRASA
jgi:signal transduction histidine kinase/ActR/RegA family two-component response regulator/HAMP domain-containing protein